MHFRAYCMYMIKKKPLSNDLFLLFNTPVTFGYKYIQRTYLFIWLVKECKCIACWNFKRLRTQKCKRAWINIRKHFSRAISKIGSSCWFREKNARLPIRLKFKFIRTNFSWISVQVCVILDILRWRMVNIIRERFEQYMQYHVELNNICFLESLKR